MAEKPLRKNELGVIALLSGMIRQYKETNTLDDVHNLICKTSDEILDICEGETPKQTESNFSIPVVVNWVALKDEQPPKNDVYYCYGHGKKPHICNYKDGTWWRQPWSKQIVGITHWRRLPEPPCL